MCCNCNSQGHPWWKEQAKTNPLSCTVCQKPTVNNYCTNSATILGAILNYVLHLHLNFSSLFNVARQLSRSTVLGNICFRQDEKWVRIALSGESEVHTAEEELNFAQSKRTETEAHKFIYFLWFHNKKMKPEVMPFCHRFSPNYGSLVTLCCLARSVYSYRNSANSMSPFSLHRHPSILAYLTMPCGFAIHVLYTELSTYAYFEEEKTLLRCIPATLAIVWAISGQAWKYFTMIQSTFSMFLWDQRSESWNSSRGHFEMPHLKSRVEIAFCPSHGSFKPSVLKQTKMTFPKLLTCVIPEVLCCPWCHAHIAALCWTAGDGGQWEST